MKYLRDHDGRINSQVLVAVIAAVATLGTAIIAGVFGLIQLRVANAPLPTATVPTLAVDIEGPTVVPLNQEERFEIYSASAIRAEWTILDFGQGEINPFRQADYVWVEPTNENSIGETYTLIVAAYDAFGNQATARHDFEVVEE
jgi:hypothetical protein